MSQPALIAIDWGSSNFRAFLLDQQANILLKRTAKLGILKITNHDFPGVLKQQIGDWLRKYPTVAVMMSGMIGSRQGWHEAPYLQCPIALNDLGKNLFKFTYNGRYFWIMPGLMVKQADGRVDVMRGEETQIVGALSTHLANEARLTQKDEMQGKNERASGVYKEVNEHCERVFNTADRFSCKPREEKILCLPGTHSKWVWVKENIIQDFMTFMTGELFTILAKHSILSKLLRGTETNFAAFDKGVQEARVNKALLSQIFQVRTQVLADQLKPEEVHSYLSGILISNEICYALEAKATPITQVTIIANPHVSGLYARALEQFNLKATITNGDEITTHGLFNIAKSAQITS